MISFRSANRALYSQIESDAAHLAAMMKVALPDADMYLERRATCAEGYRVGADDRPEGDDQEFYGEN